MNTTRRQFLGFGMGLAAAGAWPALVSAREAGEALAWRERVLQGFGTTLWLRAAHTDAGRVEYALDRAVQRIRRVEAQMNLFDDRSALRRLNRSGRLDRPDAGLLQVLQLSRRIASESDGAFDVTMQPLWDLWDGARRDGRLPSARELQQTTARVNWRAVDANRERIWLPKGFALSLNGIAQGHAADAVRSELQAMGIRHAMLDTGETAVMGRAPDGAPWRFGIEDVRKDRAAGTAMGTATGTAAGTAAGAAVAPVITVPDGYAAATSSDAHTTFTADRIHHHILDPRSGDSPTHWSSVTVVARSAALADGLTKVFFMLPKEKVAAAARHWRVGVAMQDKSGQWLRVGLG